MTSPTPAPALPASSPPRPVLLVNTVMADFHLQQMAQQLPALELVYAPEAEAAQAAMRQHAARVQVVLTIGSIGLSAAEMDLLPALQLVCALGAGYEKVDVAHARAHGIATGNGAGTNDSCVADHAMALVLASVRQLKHYDQQLRAGVWRTALPLPAGITGKRLGVLGLGTIGRKIALRAQVFEMQVGYHNRSPKADAPWQYFDSLLALADWADVLVVATPGGATTQHLVNAPVLRALGPQGHVVNIARGSVIDTAALAAVLRSGALGAAALDVYESEPLPPQALLDLPNVLLTPHVAGWSPASVQATVDRFVANVQAHLQGQPLVSAV
ncbi:2-hydroxyacid dehydrogenase [Comamonas sp. GB3 AK4-5]|uniref:2-hydroxyacid dehydrogenase n=1 Tax=Comamonas sp. GB3 AK4-5 TaxID=3231487 RepID=UPI00351DF3B2